MQWLSQASTTAGGATDQIGYSGEKNCRLWICASRTGRKEGMFYTELNVKDSLFGYCHPLSLDISLKILR